MRNETSSGGAGRPRRAPRPRVESRAARACVVPTSQLRCLSVARSSEEEVGGPREALVALRRYVSSVGDRRAPMCISVMAGIDSWYSSRSRSRSSNSLVLALRAHELSGRWSPHQTRDGGSAPPGLLLAAPDDSKPQPQPSVPVYSAQALFWILSVPRLKSCAVDSENSGQVWELQQQHRGVRAAGGVPAADRDRRW